MDKKKRSVVVWVVVILTITLACACPSIPGNILAAKEGIETAQSVLTDIPVDGLLETVSALTTEMPLDDLMKTASVLTTQMPVEDILSTYQVISTALPFSPEDIAKTAAAGGLPILDMGVEGAPSDIPLLEDRNEDLFATSEVVSYTSPSAFDSAVEFYKTQMPANGWQPGDEPVVVAQTAVLYYQKEGRKATVTIYVANNMTGVTITID